jgi:phosphatidate cytidylyltransferase
MLRWRLLLGTIIIATLVFLGWLDHRAAVPGAWFMLVAMAFTLPGTAEVLDLARAAGMRPIGWPVYVGNVLLVVGPWAMATFLAAGTPAAGLSWLGIAVLLVFIAEMARYRTPGGAFGSLATAIFALVYVGVMLGFAVQLRLTQGMGAVAAWIIVVKMGDIGAYTVGRLIGRHKMAPAISPGKTIEGAFGALAFAAAASWAVFAWLIPLTMPGGATVGQPWQWVLYGILMGGAGMVGDLAESLVKRDVGRKDSSTWMPGFGGILDILDSLLLTAPMAWACWEWGLFTH